jgi:hypothetical protein
MLWRQCGSRGKPEPLDDCGVSKAKKPIGGQDDRVWPIAFVRCHHAPAITGGKPIQALDTSRPLRLECPRGVTNACNPSAGALQPFQTPADCRTPLCRVGSLSREPCFLSVVRKGWPDGLILVGYGSVHRRRIRRRARRGIDVHSGRIAQAIAACAGFERDALGVT